MSNEYQKVEQAMVPGTLRGYREWLTESSRHDLHRGGIRPCHPLYALNDHYAWKPGVNTAICHQGFITPGRHCGEEPVPKWGCTCGFYARHSPDFPNLSDVRKYWVGGSIKASGRVILGTEGFRAEKVEIEALYDPHGALYPCTVRMYNVPVYEDPYSFMADFPPISVGHLLPPPVPPVLPILPVTMTINFHQVDPTWLAELMGTPAAPDIEEE